MKTEWIAVEVIAIIIDEMTILYFLNSRFAAKISLFYPQILTFISLFVWGAIATFNNLPSLLYSGIANIIIFAYLLLTRHGSLWQKAFGVAFTITLTIGSSLAGAGLASMITNVSMQHTLEYQDSARLLAIILIKTIQIILFYFLAKKKSSIHTPQKRYLIVLTFAAALIFSCLLPILFNLSDFGAQTNLLLIWLAVGLMAILILVFLMYELFTREETRNFDLSARLHRLEMEANFFKEIDNIYADLRTWRHEYKNNLLAIQSFIENNSHEKALEYIKEISGVPIIDSTLLQTGNPVLDAVVSSKLMLARSRGIEVNIQSVYSKSCSIEDSDLCSIAGNLLDNAIEACNRMDKSNQKQFISFSIILKGKNITISIINSFDGKIERFGNKYISTKNSNAHGVGIIYVDSIVDKYQGHVLREYHEGVFETHVMLPLVSQ